MRKIPHDNRCVAKSVLEVWLCHSLCFLGTSPNPISPRFSSQSAGSMPRMRPWRADPDTNRHGRDLSQLMSIDPKFASFLASTLVDDGISGVGLAVFGMVVSMTSYRKGEKWAWYVSWSMPIGILAAQLNVCALTGSIMVIYLAAAFTLVSVLALLLPYRQFFLESPMASRDSQTV